MKLKPLEMPKSIYIPSLRGTVYTLLAGINQRLQPSGINIYLVEQTKDKEKGPRMDIYASHPLKPDEQLLGNANDERLATFLLGMTSTLNLLNL